MKRIKGSKVLEEREMHDLAKMLNRCGFKNAAVGLNYIDFYDHVEVRRIERVYGKNAAAASGAE